jgi:hypothetical protein
MKKHTNKSGKEEYGERGRDVKEDKYKSVPSSGMCRRVPLKHRFLARATQHYSRHDVTLHSHSRENLKSYIALTGWAL